MSDTKSRIRSLERKLKPDAVDLEAERRRVRVRESLAGGLKRVMSPQRREILQAYDAAPRGRVSDIVAALREGRRMARPQVCAKRDLRLVDPETDVLQ